MTATVLVVDDEELVRMQIAATLEFDGYTAAQAANGTEAVEWLKHNRADVMITDILMPSKEGLETILEVRRNHPHLKIIAMSGRAPSESVDFLATAQEFGANRVMPKPFGRIQLLDTLRELLGDPPPAP